jgi:hypothetical protein
MDCYVRRNAVLSTCFHTFSTVAGSFVRVLGGIMRDIQYVTFITFTLCRTTTHIPKD